MPPGPARKSHTGLILALVIGAVLLLGAVGGGVWVFFLSGPGGPGSGTDPGPFPTSYQATEPAAATGFQYSMTKPEGYDLCVDVNLDGIEAVLPTDGKPKATTTDDDGAGTGFLSCGGALRARGDGPTGAFDLAFLITKDDSAASDQYAQMRDQFAGFESFDSYQLGNEAEILVEYGIDVVKVAVPFRNGNLAGAASITLNHGDYTPPSPWLLADALSDGVNSALNRLSGA